MTSPGRTWNGEASRGTAGLGKAGPGGVWRGKARHGNPVASEVGWFVRSASIGGAYWLVTPDGRCSCPATVAECVHVLLVLEEVGA